MRKHKTGFWMVAALFTLSVMAQGGPERLYTVPLEKDSQEDTILKGAQKYLNRQNEEKFPLAAKLDEKGWFFVDLKPQCNLNIFSKDGKTCPVTYPFMKTGKQVFYGISFEIIAPEGNDNKTVIALPSKRLLPGELPRTQEVAVGRKAKILYFLHTTYYTTAEGEQFYQINYDDGTNQKIKFVGNTHSGDWYHPHTRIYTEDVHYVLIPAAEGSKTFHRNMHIFQWMNPSPEKAIKSITFGSDPEADMAILVVAVTGHPG